MKKLEIVNAKEQSEAIRNEIFRSDESRYDHRLHGLLLVSEGMSCYNTGDILVYCLSQFRTNLKLN